MRILVPTSIPFDYESRGLGGRAGHLYLLLHGFGQSGRLMIERLASCLPESAAIVAPNGPFPLPEKKEDRYRLGFSWYFYDPTTRDYFIDMEPATEFLVEGLSRLGFRDTPKTVIGFSQGGYLAPIAAQKMSAVTQVVGIGSEFLAAELSGRVTFQVDGIVGDRDRYFTADEARAGDRELRKLGVRGKLHLLTGVGHEINDEVRAALGRVLIR